MPVPSKDPMSALYSKLGRIGFPKKYVREVVLPEWWEDEIAHNPSGFAQGLLILSRNLGLDLSSLQNESVPVGLRNLGPCKFKKSESKSHDELEIARILATRLAELASQATPASTEVLGANAQSIREDIFKHGEPWVGFPQLVHYCWTVGIPVLFVGSFPAGSKKMDGLAWAHGLRRAIVLSNNKKYWAWHLFILAHELGHLVLRHVLNGALLDEVVDRSDTDKEEAEANAFALELLTGSPDSRVITAGSQPTPNRLSEAALKTGRQERIDPGHLILNFAHGFEVNGYGLANAALGILQKGTDGPKFVREMMLGLLDKSKLSEEAYEFIERLTQVRESA